MTLAQYLLQTTRPADVPALWFWAEELGARRPPAQPIDSAALLPTVDFHGR